MSFFAAFDAVVGVAHSAIEGLASLLTPAAGDLAPALAIVGFTILVRLLVSPLSWLQARSAKRGAALAPEIAKLREKHKDDPVVLAQETLALQRANGAGPGASLLPALVQAPFFMIMYRLVQPGSGAPGGLLAGNLFGVPLTAHLMTGLPVFAALLALATGLAVWSSRRARRALTPAEPVASTSTPAGVATRPASAGKRVPGVAASAGKRASGKRVPGVAASAGKQASGKRASGVAAAGASGEAAASLAGRLVTFLPYVTVLMVAWLPLAGALYMVTSTAWTALEQALWRRPVAAINR